MISSLQTLRSKEKRVTLKSLKPSWLKSRSIVIRRSNSKQSCLERTSMTVTIKMRLWPKMKEEAEIKWILIQVNPIEI